MADGPTYHDHSPHPKHGVHPRLNILLSNGRFPVSLDLARQLRRAGHNVYCCDPMEFHVCKFSQAVRRSWQSPAPIVDPEGYIDTVMKAVEKANIDIIIPMHEEVLYLAECLEPKILDLLFAPKFLELYQLHHKWEFNELLGRVGLDRPEAYFCTTHEDVEKLDKSREWALKPVLGRSSTGVYHLKPDEFVDISKIDISPENPHIAQEWLKGNRYCTYGIFRKGQVQAFCIYPVMETIDGSSSVYFEACEHEEIKQYVTILVKKLHLTGQLAFDFIETGVEEGELRRGPHGIPRGDKYRLPGSRRLSLLPKRQNGQPPKTESPPRRIVAIECNPRSTSGIHLWSGTAQLAVSLTDVDVSRPELAAKPGRSRQTGPGMLMWEHKEATLKRYFEHLTRLFGTKDVMWSWKDIFPMLMQPFLLASYYRICHEKGGIPLPEMFQSDLVWEPGLFGESKKMGLKISEPFERSMPDMLLKPEAT